jgi:hypothetical protein
MNATSRKLLAWHLERAEVGLRQSEERIAQLEKSLEEERASWRDYEQQIADLGADLEEASP